MSSPSPNPTAGGVPLYIRVTDPSGEPIRGLSAGAFEISEEDSPLEILSFLELNRAAPDVGTMPEAGVNLVLYISEALNFRESFRAKRAARALIEQLDLETHAVAVYSNAFLSGLTRDRSRLRALLAYFGEHADRSGFGSPPSPTSSWRDRWPPSREAIRSSLQEEVRRLVSRGSRGNISTTLSQLKELPGWNILIYFGKDVPYGDKELERHDLRFGARILSDAGFSVFAFNPSGALDRGWQRLKIWTELTGGEAISDSGDLRQTVLRRLQKLSHVYFLRYQDSGLLDSRWRPITLGVTCQECVVSHGTGRFATTRAALSLAERTFLTAALDPAAHRDFPIFFTAELKPAPVDVPSAGATRALKFSLSFPFSAAWDEDTKTVDSTGGLFHQQAQFFVGIYDRSRRLIGRFQTPAFFSMEPWEAVKALQERARLDQSIEIPPLAQGETIWVIVVSGQNRRISVQRFAFPSER